MPVFMTRTFDDGASVVRSFDAHGHPNDDAIFGTGQSDADAPAWASVPVDPTAGSVAFFSSIAFAVLVLLMRASVPTTLMRMITTAPPTPNRKKRGGCSGGCGGGYE